jgi:hypothetical protein
MIAGTLVKQSRSLHGLALRQVVLCIVNVIGLEQVFSMTDDLMTHSPLSSCSILIVISIWFNRCFNPRPTFLNGANLSHPFTAVS